MTKLAERIIREKSTEFSHWSMTFNSFMDISYNDVAYRAADEADIWMDTGIRDDWEGPQFLLLAVKGRAGIQKSL